MFQMENNFPKCSLIEIFIKYKTLKKCDISKYNFDSSFLIINYYGDTIPINNVENIYDNTTKIKLIFQDMNGQKYPIVASYEDRLYAVVFALLKKYENIVKETVSKIMTNKEKQITLKENVKKNNLKDVDVIKFKF